MEVNISQNKTFRYQISCKGKNPVTVLYALHGYGQLAKFFIQKFNHLEDIIVVSPEGGHRFYLEGTSGRVGASWMTKDARETDIQDNINYLNDIDKKISKEYTIEKRILLGFSQGGATAIRWRNESQIKFNSLIVWASDHPKDSVSKKGNDYFIIGDKDEFIHSKNKTLMIEDYESKGFKICSYIGAHDIDKDTLNILLNNIRNESFFGTVSD